MIKYIEYAYFEVKGGRKMNRWTERSVALAENSAYLDRLMEVYPMPNNQRRIISRDKWRRVEDAYNSENGTELIKALLALELFPLKDSYVAYLKKDADAIRKNPLTTARISERLLGMSLEEIRQKCTEPKETNRQIGPAFKRWIDGGALGLPVYNNIDAFLESDGNGVLNVSDKKLERFAREHLGYNHDKGLDFVARVRGKYVLGETKFLTDFGGHQNAQFADAISTINSELLPNPLGARVIKIAIMDGVLYKRGDSKLYKHLTEHSEQIILSSLLLREFLNEI